MCCLDFADIAFLVMVFSSSVIVSAKTIIVHVGSYSEHTFGSRHWKYFRVVKQDNGNTPIWSESGVGSNGDYHSEDSARDDVGVVVMIS